MERFSTRQGRRCRSRLRALPRSVPPAFRFLLVGAFSAFLDFSITACALWLGVHYRVAAILGLTSAVGFNYVGHARFTFPGATLGLHSLGRYLLVLLANYALTYGVMTVGVAFMEQPPLVAKVGAMIAVAINGYLWSKHWIFKEVTHE